jgi:hypothetical protein
MCNRAAGDTLTTVISMLMSPWRRVLSMGNRAADDPPEVLSVRNRLLLSPWRRVLSMGNMAVDDTPDVVLDVQQGCW